jgi:hypothetical protein
MAMKRSGVRRTHTKLYEALTTLFELLELYSPPWYKEQHYDQASTALKDTRRRGRKVRIK